MLAYTGPTANAAARLVVEESNPRTAADVARGHLFRVRDGFHFVGSDDDFGRRLRANARY